MNATEAVPVDTSNEHSSDEAKINGVPGANDSYAKLSTNAAFYRGKANDNEAVFRGQPIISPPAE